MNNAQFGFKDGDIEIILNIIASFTAIDKAVIFGSRAKGNYQQGSDVDIALFTKNNSISPQLSFKLNEESLLPYKFDVIDFNTLTHADLIEHINRVGIVIYQK